MQLNALRLLVPLVAGAAFLGCGAFDGMHTDHTGGSRTPPSSPRVRVVEVRLGAHPTNAQLAAHFCMERGDGVRLGPAGVAACRALGTAPTDAQLAVRFEVELEISNTNFVAVPVVRALVGATLFPASGAPENLGALCVTLCEQEDACPQSDEHETDCEHALPGLGHAATGFLTSVTLAEERFEDLRVLRIPPHGNVRLTLSLALDGEHALALIEQASASEVALAREGLVPTFAIPYQIDGSIWVEASGFGRVVGTFAPSTGTWELATGE